MRILRLKFRNINNLKGEHEVDFDQLPLSSAGIFAIVGATGSGKSTILDVITLALFNRIPRFKKPISKNEITKEGAVLTHHTNDASASIEYEIKGQKYTSAWSVSTNKNGKLRDHEMILYGSDDTPMDLKKSEVPARNEAIIGLNYDQFIKSILLSQGEFSKFLKADKNDRGKLLEKITGTSIYRNIGISAYEKHKQAKETLELEERLIGETVILKDEERNELGSQLKQAQAEKINLVKALDELIKLKQIKSDILGFETNMVEKTKLAKEIESKVSAFKESQKKLILHHKLSPLQGQMASYNDAIANAKQSDKNLKEYQNELKNANSLLAQSIDGMANLTGQKVDQDSFKKIMSAFETEINKADNTLAHLLKNGKDIRDRINTQLLDYPTKSLADIKNPTLAIKTLSARAAELNQRVAAANLDFEKANIDIRATLKQKQEELDTLKEIERKYQIKDELTSNMAKLEKELADLHKIKDTKSPLLAKTVELLQASNSNMQLLIKSKEDAIKIAKLEDDRKTLLPNTPCPLCGSLEHPYVEHLPEATQSKIDEKIDRAQGEIKTQQREIDVLKKDITQAATSIDHREKLLAEGKQATDTLTVAITKLSTDYKGALSYKAQNIVESIKVLGKENQKTELAIEAEIELKLNKALVLDYEKLGTTINDYRTLKQSRDSKFAGENVSVSTNKLQDDFENNKSRITELTAVINKETGSLNRDSNLVSSILSDLKPKIEELGFASINEIKDYFLDATTLDTLHKEQEQLTRAETRVETEIKTIKHNLEKQTKADSQPELPLHTLIQEIDKQKAVVERSQNTIITNQERLKRDDQDRAKYQSKENQITILKKELEKWSLLNKMIGDATGNKFANFAQGLTLQNLLVYANRRLENLSDRYLLDKPENDGALIVIDKYQGNISRSVTTLSGGESFLISLALALSLSDMASKNVALECLYIDEGFGTLDPESLETALNTLEKLQTESQKTVGVISHVEALKERIDVQIKLNKNAQGYSQIEVGRKSE